MKFCFNSFIFLVIYFLAAKPAFATNIPFGFFKVKSDKITIISSAQTLLAGNCSGVTTVQYQTPSNAPKNATSNLTVNITAVAGLTYYSDVNCLTPITSVTILTGTSTSNFYFISDTTGTKNIALSASAALITSQNETVNTNGFVWMGGGGNALWSTAANWVGGVVPGASDTALFNSACVSNCSPTIAANISVVGVRIASGYAGTITQNAGITITLDSVGWFQNGGTFAGNNAAVTINGRFTLASGTFTATSATTTITNSFLISGSPTFNANAGTILFSSSTDRTIMSGSIVYNNVSFQLFYAFITLADNMTINGNLILGGTNTLNLNGASLLVSGNVALSNIGGGYGTSLLKLVGSGNQTLTSVAGAYIPNLEIASTGGTVTYSGTLNFRQGYTFTSGTVDATGTTVIFGDGNGSGTYTIVPGTTAFNNVTFKGYSTYYTLNGTMTVNGALSLTDIGGGPIFTGTFLVSGDVVVSGLGAGGSALIKLVGTGNQSVTGIATASIPNFEIASTGGTVSLSGTLRFMRNFTYTSGTIAAGTSTIAFGDNNANTNHTLTTTGAVAFNNVTFQGYSSPNTINGTLVVNGALTLSDNGGGQINTGTIQANGNVTCNLIGHTGTGTIQMMGGAAATLSQTCTYIPLGFSINKTAGVTVSLATNVSLMQNTQTLNVTSGNIDMAGKNLTIKSSLALNGNTLTKNAGVLTVNSVVAGSGALFGGTVNP